MIKKILLILLIPFIFCGCSRKEDFDTIVFSSWGSITEVKIIKKIIKDFENENPNIKINFLHIPQNYFQKIHLLIASNTAPDVIFINNLYLPIYESHLEDLSDSFDKEAFYQQAIDNLSINNKILAIPRDISNLVFYVNLDKIQMPSSNWTLDDLLEIAINSTNRNSFGLGAQEDIYWAIPYINYFNGGILNEKGEFIYNSENTQAGINYYKDLIHKYKVAPTKSQIGSSTLAQMFIDEKIAIYLSGRWMYPKISEKADFNWAVINFPYGKSKQLIDASGWAVTKKSKNKECAKKFVNFLASEKSSQYFTQTGLIVPARKDCAESLNNNKHNEKIFINTIEKSTKTPVNKNYKKIIDKINKEIF